MNRHLTLRDLCARVADKTGYSYQDVRLIIEAYVKFLYLILVRHYCAVGHYYSFMPDPKKEQEWPIRTRTSYNNILLKRKRKKVKIAKQYYKLNQKKCQLTKMTFPTNPQATA